MASTPEKQAGIAWPLPVDHYLDRLLAQAHQSGERTSRKELAAAVVSAAVLTDNELGELLKRYRTRTVADLFGLTDASDRVVISKKRPGPRDQT